MTLGFLFMQYHAAVFVGVDYSACTLGRARDEVHTPH
jgi:hypothetical protein